MSKTYKDKKDRYGGPTKRPKILKFKKPKNEKYKKECDDASDSES